MSVKQLTVSGASAVERTNGSMYSSVAVRANKVYQGLTSGQQLVTLRGFAAGDSPDGHVDVEVIDKDGVSVLDVGGTLDAFNGPAREGIELNIGPGAAGQNGSIPVKQPLAPYTVDATHFSSGKIRITMSGKLSGQQLIGTFNGQIFWQSSISASGKYVLEIPIAVADISAVAAPICLDYGSGVGTCGSQGCLNPPAPCSPGLAMDIGTVIGPITPNHGGGAPASYTSTVLPAGVLLNATTGVLSGTCSATLSGPTSVIITATNAGGSTTCVVTFIPLAIMGYPAHDLDMSGGVDWFPVINSNLMPGVIQGGGPPPPFGTPIITFSTTGNLPPGATVDSASGELSGPPLGSGGDTFTIIATNGTVSASWTINWTVLF